MSAVGRWVVHFSGDSTFSGADSYQHSTQAPHWWKCTANARDYVERAAENWLFLNSVIVLFEAVVLSMEIIRRHYFHRAMFIDAALDNSSSPSAAQESRAGQPWFAVWESLHIVLYRTYSGSKLYNEKLLKENQIKNQPARQKEVANGNTIKYQKNYLKSPYLQLSARWIHILIALDEVCRLSFFFYYTACIMKFFTGIDLFTQVFIFHWHIHLNTPSLSYEGDLFYLPKFGAGSYSALFTPIP